MYICFCNLGMYAYIHKHWHRHRHWHIHIMKLGRCFGSLPRWAKLCAWCKHDNTWMCLFLWFVCYISCFDKKHTASECILIRVYAYCLGGIHTASDICIVLWDSEFGYIYIYIDIAYTESPFTYLQHSLWQPNSLYITIHLRGAKCEKSKLITGGSRTESAPSAT